jgi:hypothetical protein
MFVHLKNPATLPVVPVGAAALAPLHHSPHHFFSTFRSQAGILVYVHSVLRESLLSGDISFAGQDRMDNLLKVHI